MSNEASVETLVDELKTDYHRSQFESLFKRKTQHLSGPEKLRARMQINELAKPALGVVDLRRKIPAEVEPYRFQGRTHYFDLAAKKLFEEGLRRYKGVFTNDTKQQILALKAHHQQLAENKALAEDIQENVLGSFVAGRSYRRRSERMNIVTPVSVELANGEQFAAMTVDISNYGLQLKLSLDPQLASLKHGRIKIYFSGFSDDFTFDGDLGYEYRVVGVKEKDLCLYLRLKRLDEPVDDELSHLLCGMLAKFRRRYKVNVDHVVQRVIARSHEACWLEAIQGLPVLLRDESSICMIIQTKANQPLLNSWQQHQNDLIAELFEQPWVQSVVEHLRCLRKAARQQVVFFRISLPVNKVWREYLLPLHAIGSRVALMTTLSELRGSGYAVRCYQLTLTYHRERRLVYTELNSIKAPLWRKGNKDKGQVSELKKYSTKGAQKLSCQIVKENTSAKQEIFRYVLSSALFLYKGSVEWEPRVAGLMPLNEGLPDLLSESDFWLANGDRILGGSRLSTELRGALRRMPAEQQLQSRILLLRVSQTSQKAGVIGRYLGEYESFQEAAEYIRFLNDDQNFVAILVAGHACESKLPNKVMDDLSYIQRYLPHRARELEQNLRQLRAVMTLTDVTHTLNELAEFTAKL